MPIVHMGLPQACSNYGMVQPEIIKSIKKILFLTQHHCREMVLQRNGTSEFDLGPNTTV